MLLIVEKRNCDINNVIVLYFFVYIVEILCKWFLKLLNVIIFFYGCFMIELMVVCEIYGMKNLNIFIVDIYFIFVFNKNSFNILLFDMYD